MKRIILFSIFLSVLLMGCERESIFDQAAVGLTEDYDGGGHSGSGGNGGSNTTDHVAENVRNRVLPFFSYNSTRLYYDVSISSTLESVYPNKDITYGVEYGYDNTYCYYKTKKKQYGNISFIVPVGNAYPATGDAGFAFWQYDGWQFSVWDWVERFGAGTYPSSIFTIQQHYKFIFYLGAMYNVLHKKYDLGETLYSSDNDLYQSAWDAIKGDYYNVKNRLCGRAFVLVDGVKYVID